MVGNNNDPNRGGFSKRSFGKWCDTAFVCDRSGKFSVVAFNAEVYSQFNFSNIVFREIRLT